MTAEFDRELAELRRQIAHRHRQIEDQKELIEVLERDGHDVAQQELALKKERSELASQIARHFHLVQRTTAHLQSLDSSLP